jgi:hypothetical protein
MSDGDVPSSAPLASDQVILAVTGSRRLRLSALAQAWARTHISNVMDETGFTHFVHGGAPGPDTIGGEMATDRGRPVLVYRIGGVWSLLSTEVGKVKEGRWSVGPTASDPLARNIALVRFLRRREVAGSRVILLGVEQEGTPTSGTGHTMRKAMDLGIVDVRSVKLSLDEEVEFIVRERHVTRDAARDMIVRR